MTRGQSYTQTTVEVRSRNHPWYPSLAFGYYVRNSNFKGDIFKQDYVNIHINYLRDCHISISNIFCYLSMFALHGPALLMNLTLVTIQVLQLGFIDITQFQNDESIYVQNHPFGDVIGFNTFGAKRLNHNFCKRT